MIFLGLDLGTSAIKAMLTGPDQAVLAEASVPLDLARPQAGYAEQDPQDWWRALVAAIAALRASDARSLAAVSAIGLSGQMHAAVLLDGADRVLRPAIIWADGRAAGEAEALNAEIPELGEIAGVPAMASFVAPKLRWLATHEPRSLAAMRRLSFAKDYLRLRMTGEHATDMCEAAGSLLLDERQRRWSPVILDALGLSAEHLPRLCEGTEVTGRLSAAAAAELGLKPGLPVAAGAGDAAAGAIGMGAASDGDAIISLGTATQYFIATGSYRPAPREMVHAFAHGLPRLWFQMAALLNGASALAWAAGLMGRGDAIGALLAETERAFTGPGDLIFLPYLMGERTPHNDPHARGMIYGLTPGTGATDIALAVLEGVALSLADAQDCLARAGSDSAAVSVTGGGARSAFWMRLLAAILDRPVHLREGADKGPAFGAARLARLALTGEPIPAVCTKQPVIRSFEPDSALAAGYAPKLRTFRAAYRALKPIVTP